MKQASVAKFPNSAQLFRFCQRVLVSQKGGKIHDQEVGSILNFNPSDCSHWKRGEKNVKSVFALAKLAEALNIEVALIHDVANGVISVEEAFYEYAESRKIDVILEQAHNSGDTNVQAIREQVELFVKTLHQKADFSTAPLYLPEIMRFFPFVSSQQADLLDRLSRVLKIKKGSYSIKYRRGDIKPQTRMSICRDLARILFRAERHNYPG